MNKLAGFLVGMVVLAGIAVIAWYHYGPPSQAPLEAPTPAAAEPPPATSPPPEPEYRVPEPAAGDGEAAPTLPALPDSDAAARGELENLFGKAPVEAYLVPSQLIRRWVAFIDSLDRGGLPPAQRPIKPVDGAPVVARDGDTLVLDPRNEARYAPYLAVLRAVDVQDFVGFYFRYYPLFQRAYEELGYGGRYFNTRLLRVIDHLLATPAVDGPIALLQPSVRYEFADPDLQARSYGQKLLIRLGPAGEAAVKDKLREIRATIVARAKQPSVTGAVP